MRAFACTLLPPPLQDRCAAVIATLIASSDGLLRSIPAGTAHLTYAFMASAPEAHLPALVAALRDVAVHQTPIAVRLGPPDILHGGVEARLVHLPADEGREALAALARVVTDAARHVLPGADVALTPAPHVTLARFRRGTHRRAARAVADTIAERLTDMRLDVSVDAVHLVESVLGTTGPQYRTRAAMPFTGAQ